MSSNNPTVRQIAWVSLIPQLLFMGLLFLLFYQFSKDDFILYGALTYLALSYILKFVLAKYHRNGISLFNNQDFKNGIELFEKSYAFFDDNVWLDKYRYLTLLSASRMSYREMALVNIAFGYSQIGDGIKSIEYYERTLQEFPENNMAKAALRMINSVKK